jgi:type III pantothenate kinase
VVDAVSAGREFLGGAVAIGVQSGLEALAEKTAALPRVEASRPQGMIGRDTEECLRAGAACGTAALVEGVAERMREEIGAGAPLVVTGGHAELVSRCLRGEHEVAPTLTLEGVAAVWEHNLPASRPAGRGRFR